MSRKHKEEEKIEDVNERHKHSLLLEEYSKKKQLGKQTNKDNCVCKKALTGQSSKQELMDKLLGHANDGHTESTALKDRNHLRSKSMAKIEEAKQVSYMDHTTDQGTASVTKRLAKDGKDYLL